MEVDNCFMLFWCLQKDRVDCGVGGGVDVWCRFKDFECLDYFFLGIIWKFIWEFCGIVYMIWVFFGDDVNIGFFIQKLCFD